MLIERPFLLSINSRHNFLRAFSWWNGEEGTNGRFEAVGGFGFVEEAKAKLGVKGMGEKNRRARS
jgi:hypothetical protein